MGSFVKHFLACKHDRIHLFGRVIEEGLYVFERPTFETILIARSIAFLFSVALLIIAACVFQNTRS